jgi:ubiquinone/menaquinone biosynthesis C-methylase UbiE
MAKTRSEVTKAKLDVMVHFDKEASEFDFERTSAGYQLRHKLVSGLITKEYKPDTVALDLGCGTGEYIEVLAQTGFEVVGGDLSRGMLAIAKSKIEKHKLARKIQLVRLESTRLPFQNGTFNVIMCIALLDWVPDAQKLLHETSRVLIKQAKLIICVDALWSPYRIYRKVQFLINARRKRYSRIISARELRQTLTMSGFVVETFFGDVLLAQILTHLLFDPKATRLANTILKATQPFDRRLANLPFVKSFYAHYIVKAKKI